MRELTVRSLRRVRRPRGTERQVDDGFTEFKMLPRQKDDFAVKVPVANRVPSGERFATRDSGFR